MVPPNFGKSPFAGTLSPCLACPDLALNAGAHSGQQGRQVEGSTILTEVQNIILGFRVYAYFGNYGFVQSYTWHNASKFAT